MLWSGGVDSTGALYRILKDYDDDVSKIIFRGKRNELKQEIYHKDVDLSNEALVNASTRERYDKEVTKIDDRIKEEKEKEKKEKEKKKKSKFFDFLQVNV